MSSSPSGSSVSFGWEEVNISEWDDESSLSDSSLDSKCNEKVKAVGLSSAVGNQEEKVENLGTFEMAEKTNQRGSFSKNSTSKAHELSESEDSSAELNALPAFNTEPANSSMNLNETVASISATPSCRRNLADELSSSESNKSDGDSEEISNNNSKVFTDAKEKKIDILKQNNQVLSSKLKEELSVENIDDEEIWMVQCPLDLDPKKLVNKEFNFAGISEFAVDTEDTEKVYTATAHTGCWKSLSCLLPSLERKQLEAVVVNAAGQIIITEKVTNSQLNSTVPARSNKVEFPENLKVRHPLFGADYEKELDIRRQRLLVSSLVKKKKKKKKHKEIPNDTSFGTASEEQVDGSIPSLSEDMQSQKEITVTSKKGKKRRHSASFITNSDHSDKDDTSKQESRHLKKKLRKSLPSSDLDESVVTEILINKEYSKKKKKKKKKHDFE